MRKKFYFFQFYWGIKDFRNKNQKIKISFRKDKI
jgi:hypothetical protein